MPCRHSERMGNGKFRCKVAPNQRTCEIATDPKQYQDCEYYLRPAHHDSEWLKAPMGPVSVSVSIIEPSTIQGLHEELLVALANSAFYKQQLDNAKMMLKAGEDNLLRGYAIDKENSQLRGTNDKMRQAEMTKLLEKENEAVVVATNAYVNAMTAEARVREKKSALNALLRMNDQVLRLAAEKRAEYYDDESATSVSVVKVGDLW